MFSIPVYFIMSFILWWQSWIFSIITPVFSVTSFRNHSNTDLLLKLKTVVLLKFFFVEIVCQHSIPFTILIAAHSFPLTQLDTSLFTIPWLLITVTCVPSPTWTIKALTAVTWLVSSFHGSQTTCYLPASRSSKTNPSSLYHWQLIRNRKRTLITS